MTTSPRERLAGALAVQTNLGNVALKAGVAPRAMLNASMARPVNTVAYVRIAAAIGFDPSPELEHVRIPPSDFSFALFAMGFFVRRGANRHSDRAAAKLIDVSPSTISRIERGDVMSIGVVLRGCRYIGLHAFGYCGLQDFLKHSEVSRETPTKTPLASTG